MTLESGNLQTPICDLTRYGSRTPVRTPPVVFVRDFGAVGDGQTDDSDAINRAIRSLSSGGTVVFDAGKTYLKRKLVHVRNPGVKLWGYGATIYSYVTPDELRSPERGARVAFVLHAPDTAAYGLTIVTNMRKRPLGLPGYAGIFLRSSGQEAIDNRFEYTANGVIAEATNFLIARNVVYRTTADGIHVTEGSSVGRIACNVVRETGDDMIAVVNYGSGEPNIADFLIEDNDVGGNYWGRGIVVAGGRDVTIRRNKVASTTYASGIYIVAEEFSKTRNVRNVLIEDNAVSGNQSTTPAYNPLRQFNRSRMAAIEVQGQGERQVGDVLFRRNTVNGSTYNGIRTSGNLCGVGFFMNTLTDIKMAPFSIKFKGPDGCAGVVACSGNRHMAADIADDSCVNTPLPTVTGSPRS